jgi:hypothetical protein
LVGTEFEDSKPRLTSYKRYDKNLLATTTQIAIAKSVTSIAGGAIVILSFH